jgi:hypothetical protein
MSLATLTSALAQLGLAPLCSPELTHSLSVLFAQGRSFGGPLRDKWHDDEA